MHNANCKELSTIIHLNLTVVNKSACYKNQFTLQLKQLVAITSYQGNSWILKGGYFAPETCAICFLDGDTGYKVKHLQDYNTEVS